MKHLVNLILVALLLSFAGVAQAADSSNSNRCASAFRNFGLSQGAIKPGTVVAIAPNVPKRSWEKITSLRIMTYNVENLFWSVGKYERDSFDRLVYTGNRGDNKNNNGKGNGAKNGVSPAAEAKPERKTEQIRQILEEENADIIVVEEVESLMALQHLADNGLKGAYQSFLIQGNDERGINIGFLVKTDLPIYVEHLTNRDVTYKDPRNGNTMKLFSRDVPALVVRTSPTSAPVALILGNHAKSKRDRDGDPESNALRTAQYVGIAKLVQQYQAQYGADVPLMLAGDFNTDVRKAREIEAIRPILKSAFDVAAQTIPPEERITQSFHPSTGVNIYSQLDDVRVTPSLEKRVLSARVVAYKDDKGHPLPLPTSFRERGEQPSDHRAVVVEISLIPPK